MPSESTAQSRYLNMRFGHDWVKRHGFYNPTKGLPKHVKKRRKRRTVPRPDKHGYY